MVANLENINLLTSQPFTGAFLSFSEPNACAAKYTVNISHNIPRLSSFTLLWRCCILSFILDFWSFFLHQADKHMRWVNPELVCQPAFFQSPTPSIVDLAPCRTHTGSFILIFFNLQSVVNLFPVHSYWAESIRFCIIFEFSSQTKEHCRPVLDSLPSQSYQCLAKIYRNRFILYYMVVSLSLPMIAKHTKASCERLAVATNS